jgi:hypothetical protein
MILNKRLPAQAENRTQSEQLLVWQENAALPIMARKRKG